MREKMIRFMEGRYGYDQLNKFLITTVLTLFLLSMFFRKNLYYISTVLLIYTYYRMFSRNYAKRIKENDSFTRVYYKVKNLINYNRSMLEQKKSFKIYKCPSCNQKLRIPKGKGKVSIHCPKCSVSFIKRS